MTIITPDKTDPELSNNFIIKGYITLRGTDAWDDREQARKDHGNVCLSFGSISESDYTRGKSSVRRYGK